MATATKNGGSVIKPDHAEGEKTSSSPRNTRTGANAKSWVQKESFYLD